MVEKNGYKQTEIGVIPSDWCLSRLGELGEVKMCRRIFNHETKPTGDIPFFKIGTFGKEPDAFINEDLYIDFKKRFSFPNKGEILISAAGTIGRTVVYDGKASYFQDSNIIWINNNQNLVSNLYLLHILKVVKYTTEGGTIQRLYNSILKSTQFICPPLIEQDAIASALSDADAYINSLEKLIEKKRQIKQGAMQELLKPKDGWELKKIGDLGTCLRGVSYNPERDLYSFDGFNTIRLLRSNNIQNSKIDLNGLQFVDKLRVKRHQIIQDNDIIICMANGSKQLVGKAAKFKNNGNLDYTYGAFMGCFRTDANIADCSFVYYNFLTNSYRNYIDVLLSGSSINNLNPKNIESIEICLPKIEVQKEISETLMNFDLEIDLLNEKIEKAKSIKRGMMQNLLTGKIRLI